MLRLVIGVVGPTKSPIDAALQLARDVGQAIAKANQLPMTGGHHHGSDRYARNVVLQAAITANANVEGLGILPDASLPAPGANDPARMHYVPTGMGRRRNALTGGLPDVLIALRGGAGTLSEICFARHLGVPVTFLGWSPDVFEADLITHLDEATKNVNLPMELGLFGGPVGRDWLGRCLRETRQGRPDDFASADEALAQARQATPRPRREILSVLAKSSQQWQEVGRKVEDVLATLQL